MRRLAIMNLAFRSIEVDIDKEHADTFRHVQHLKHPFVMLTPQVTYYRVKDTERLNPYPIIASTSIKGYHHEFKALPPVVTTGRSGSLGEVLMVHTKAWPLNTALYVKDFCGNSAFLVYYTLKNMGLEKFNAGAGVPSLNRNHLTGIKINVPDEPLQKRFDELVGPIHEQKEQFVKMNEALRQTRDLLLPRLISGKLSVEDLDIQFPPGMNE